ncbi:MAG: right-handed parallel beta-helix repeat-containing protein [Phycisphaeraceae bacterium]
MFEIDRLKRFLHVFGLLLLAVALTGCHSAEPISHDDDRPIYSPKTVDAFVDAIGPNRIIELEPEMTYRLDQARRGVSDHYYWVNPLRDEHELIIRDCPGLTIRSAGPKRAHLVTRFAYAHVLGFERCDGLILHRLKLGHAPDPGYCRGGVVHIKQSKNITIQHSQLYGCGTEGLALDHVHGLRFDQSIIEDCTYGILSANESRDLLFADATFQNNREFYGFVFNNTVGIHFKNCFVTKNQLSTEYETTPLFRTNLNVPEAMIVFDDGLITDNQAGVLAQPSGMLKTTKTVIQSNKFAPTKQR